MTESMDEKTEWKNNTVIVNHGPGKVNGSILHSGAIDTCG